MNKTRVESLSDGIIAIIITVMVFNLKPPVSHEKEDVLKLIYQILSYFESFFLIGIFWYKHNKLLFSFSTMTKRIMWANHLFLFCLSLIPLVTSWSTQSPDNEWSRFFYGIALQACFISLFFMQSLVGTLNKKTALIIILVNLVSIITALYSPWLAYIFFGILGLGYLLSEDNLAQSPKQMPR
jgi:uncharacterized membrane protein